MLAIVNGHVLCARVCSLTRNNQCIGSVYSVGPERDGKVCNQIKAIPLAEFSHAKLRIMLHCAKWKFIENA